MMLGFRSRWVSIPRVPGVGVSIPDRPVIQATAPVSKVVSWGFDPTESWSRVSIPTTPGFQSLMSRVRALGGVDPAESWVSIPDE